MLEGKDELRNELMRKRMKEEVKRAKNGRNQINREMKEGKSEVRARSLKKEREKAWRRRGASKGIKGEVNDRRT